MESMQFDVVIVGAGPAGLSAAIRLMQRSQQQNKSLNVAVLEKGASVGAHLLSGAVLQPSALNQLFDDWQQRQAPVKITVTEDHFYYFGQKHTLPLPVPPTMKNTGNFIISLGEFCRWLAVQAEQLGVNIFPGFAGSQLVFSDQDEVIGVQTGDQQPEQAMVLYATQTLLAEGCRGFLSEQVIKKYQARENCDPQTYGIGVKELWKVADDKHCPGRVMHSVGWPLDKRTYGGSFVYHFKDNLVSLGLIIGLDYQNPYLDPFQELQRFKTHPYLQSLLAGGECLEYGARALNEGGLQSIPKLTFPGGLLIGCAAGFVNVGKIKGIHNAMLSGILAADSIINEDNFDLLIRESTIHTELKQARNLRPAFRKGLLYGLAYAAVDQYLLRGHAPWTLHHTKADHLCLKKAKYCQKIIYPKPDRVLTFDRLTQVALTEVKHQEQQPSHLLIQNNDIPVNYNLAQFAGPEQRYCPAGVYEFIEKGDKKMLQINFTNCIHCKTCDIKDPKQNILWTTPAGGDGPNYKLM